MRELLMSAYRPSPPSLMEAIHADQSGGTYSRNYQPFSVSMPVTPSDQVFLISGNRTSVCTWMFSSFLKAVRLPCWYHWLRNIGVFSGLMGTSVHLGP